MPERDELDRLIDSELARYAEPRAGLEQRLLARIFCDVERPSRRRKLLLALTVAMAFSLLILAYVIQTPSNPQHTQIAVTPATSSLPQVTGVPVRRPSTDPVSHVYKHSPKRLPNRARLNMTERPKLDTFPTLLPLSDSERTIIRFAADASEAERQALVSPAQELKEPIRITAIHIPPLPSSGEDTN